MSHEAGKYSFRLFSRLDTPTLARGKLKGTHIAGIENLANGQKWEWREQDLPGLRDFLGWLLRGWHPYVNKGFASEKNLACGRPQGVRTRQQTAKSRKDRVEQAVGDLFKSGQAHRMTNEAIRDFLIERKLSEYSPKSTLRTVNTIAARYRKP